MPIRASQKALRLGFIALTGLFFAWGFITCLNDILVPHLRSVFHLNYAESALVQSAFFLAYFVSSLPSASVVARFGYKRGLVIGLACMALGALLFVPAASFVSFPMFLGALFILASGITLLQVAANPYVTLLGPADSATARLNLTQAFNSLGTTLAPLIGGSLLLGAGVVAVDSAAGTSAAAQASTVIAPYAVIAAVLAAAAVLFLFLPLSEPDERPEKLSLGSVKQSLAVPGLSLGVVGIFLYVGAEVAIGSFLVSLITTTLGIDPAKAAHYVAFYWGGAMIGRFVGAWLMRYIPPARMLTIFAAGAAALVTISLTTSGTFSVYAMLAVGLCNSIMFPTIFSLGIRRLGPLTSVGSSLMVIAIVGGAVVPLAVGTLADHFGLRTAFVLPGLCYLYILFYGYFGGRVATGELGVLAESGVPATSTAP